MYTNLSTLKKEVHTVIAAGKATNDPLQRKTIDEEDDALQMKQNLLQRMEDNDEDPLEKKEKSLRLKKNDQNPLQQKQPTNNPLQLHVEKTNVPQSRKNNTSLPHNLKAGVENPFLYSTDEVKVHYNSNKPVQLQALSYAKGADIIHAAPKQEQHIPHEAWHVVQQKQGRVQPTMQAKGFAINDNAGLEKEADLMGTKLMQANTENTLLKAKSEIAASSGTLVQRQAGIPAGTQVTVNNSGSLWDGQIVDVNDISGTYDIQSVTGNISTVQQTQVDYHQMTLNAEPEKVAMERFVAALPVIDLAGDMAGLAGTNATEILAARGTMARDRDVAQLTIAMFQYMATHAVALSTQIAQDFLTLKEGDKRLRYLEAMSAAMMRKIQRGLWIGGDDKGMLAVDALDAAEYFARGRGLLIQKAAAALAANKSLVSLLENHSNNMDAKSYGRRQESMELVDIGALATPGINIAPPVANVPVLHNRAGFVYYDDNYTKVSADLLVSGQEYTLHINNEQSISVTVSANGVDSVTFSLVT